MDATEKRQVETELLKMGLAGLQANGDPSADLVQQIAGMVNDWPGHWNRSGEWIDKHKFLRDLLAECDQKDRSEMYSSILPHLKFPVHALSEYESMIASRVGSLVDSGKMRVQGRAPHPIEIGGKRFIEANRELATHAVALLKCQRCRQTKQFLGDTPADAMTKARKAGWQRIGRETCPKCVPLVNAKMKVN